MRCKAVIGLILTAVAWNGVAAVTGSEVPIERLEFVDAPVAAIVLGLGRAAGAPIVVDSDVVGRASYYFEETSFPVALYEFAAHMGLFVETDSGVYRVSTIRVRELADGTVEASGRNVSAARLIDRLAAYSRHPVTHTIPASERVTFHARSVQAEAAIEQITDQLQSYELVRSDSAFRIAPVEAGWRQATPTILVERSEDGFTLESEPARADEVLRALFAEAGEAYHLLLDPALTLPELSHGPLPFRALLQLLLDHLDARYQIEEGIYTIVRAHPGTVEARLQITERVWLRELGASELPALLGSELLAGGTLRPAGDGRSIVIAGSVESVRRIAQEIRSLDTPRPEPARLHLPLVWLRPRELRASLPGHLRGIEIVEVDGGVLATGPPSLLSQLAGFAEAADTMPVSFPFELRYLTSAELLDRLPPYIAPEEITLTANLHRFIFTGSAERAGQLARELASIDRPQPVIRYRILVIESAEGEALDHEASFANGLSTPESQTSLVGSLGNVLGLRFDVVSAFGYEFAFRLSTAISRSRASVVADAVLSGVSGSTVEFRNTGTYRYRDAATDPGNAEDAGDQIVGVTRELTSGLLLSLTGVTRPERIAVTISVSLSRQGTAAGSGANPPPTSEKVVQTQVLVRPGEPIILSGLTLDEQSASIRETPFLGRLPLVRWLFANESRSNERTELGIYLIPQLMDEARPIPSALEIVERFIGSESP